MKKPKCKSYREYVSYQKKYFSDTKHGNIKHTYVLFDENGYIINALKFIYPDYKHEKPPPKCLEQILNDAYDFFLSVLAPVLWLFLVGLLCYGVGRAFFG